MFTETSASTESLITLLNQSTALTAQDSISKLSSDSNLQFFSQSSATNIATMNNGGLRAEYYSGTDFNTLKDTRVDSTIDFDWNSGSPSSLLEGDNFSTRWTGQVQPKYSETYTFSTFSDDGVRLWVDGQLLVDNWTLHAPTENQGQITLQAGQLYDIKLEYFENTGGAVSKFSWFSLSQTKEIIPQSQLYLPSITTSAISLTPAYYVATTGDDNNTGTQNAPFRTIQRAANAAKAGDTVMVKGGTYRETVIPTNSGTHSAPITFQSAPDETVSIRGTTEIPTSSWTRVGNTNTWYTDWSGNYTSSNNQSDQVFVDGKMANLARWPQETNNNLSLPRQATIDSIVSLNDTGKKSVGPEYSINQIIFTDAEWDQPNAFWNGAKVWVNTGGLDNGSLDDSQDGNGTTGVVVSTDSENKQITIEIAAGATSGDNIPDNFQLGKGSYYYLFDPPSANGLLYNGEFWHDRSSNRLYLQTPDGSPPSNHIVEVKERDYAFNLDSKSFIIIKGFEVFAASITTDEAAGNGRGNGGNREGSIAPANHILLDGLKFNYVSHFTDQTGNIQTQWSQSSGVILSGSQNVIQNSEISWSAGSGLVVIGKESKALNNIIHDTNYTATDGGAISLGRYTSTLSQDHEIGYNTIYNTGIDGIDFSALKNSSGSKLDIKARIHHNIVHDTVLQSADSGAIKATVSDGGWVRIDHNIIYNTGGTNVADKYVFYGIYLDYPQSKGEYVVDHNLVYNTATGMNINSMKNVDIYNNTFIARPENARGTISANGSLENVVIQNLLSNRELRIDISGVTLSNNIFNATETSEWFVDATNSDLSKRSYKLASGAFEAIDQGVNIILFNDAVPADIGAYEF